jgi:8-oxo-dGTP diphosphatase
MDSEKKYCYEYPRPALTADVALFSYNDNDLKILLIERGHDPYMGSWALPGGFIDENETIIHAAKRELFEETNLKISDLTQIYVATDPGRDPRGWTISVLFMGYIRELYSDILAGDDAKNINWFSVKNLPSLAFDHDILIKEAKNSLLNHSRFSIVGPGLLPDKFSFHEIRNLYIQIGNSEKQTDFLINRLITSNIISKIEIEFYFFYKNEITGFKETGFNSF